MTMIQHPPWKFSAYATACYYCPCCITLIGYVKEAVSFENSILFQTFWHHGLAETIRSCLFYKSKHDFKIYQAASVLHLKALYSAVFAALYLLKSRRLEVRFFKSQFPLLSFVIIVQIASSFSGLLKQLNPPFFLVLWLKQHNLSYGKQNVWQSLRCHNCKLKINYIESALHIANMVPDTISSPTNYG